jgi:hypothetical protein
MDWYMLHFSHSLVKTLDSWWLYSVCGWRCIEWVLPSDVNSISTVTWCSCNIHWTGWNSNGYSSCALNTTILLVNTLDNSSIVCCRKPSDIDDRRLGDTTCVSSSDPVIVVGYCQSTVPCIYPTQPSDSPQSCRTSHTTGECLLSTTIQLNCTIWC